VLKHYADRDPDLYASCLSAHKASLDAKRVAGERREAQWAALIKSVGGK
jgi:hypothetical protein